MRSTPLLIVQRRHLLGWIPRADVKTQLASGHIEQDAFWADEVSYIKPGRTVHDYSLSELIERARFSMFNRESPFQLNAYDLLNLDFIAIRQMGDQAGQREVAIALIAGRIASRFREKVPYPMKPAKPIDPNLCRRLAAQAYDSSPASFGLVESGLQLSIHAELVDDSLADEVASALLAKLRLERPDVFQYVYDAERAGDLRMKWSRLRDNPVDHEFDSAWSRHMGV